MIDRHYSAVADDHKFMLRMASQDIKPKEEKTPNPATKSRVATARAAGAGPEQVEILRPYLLRL